MFANISSAESPDIIKNADSDEKYDSESSFHRFNYIADVIKNLESNPNKLQWFKWLRPKLEYNAKVLQFNSLFKPPQGFYDLIDLLK